MRIDVLTIFPEYLDPLRHALLGKAMEQGIMQVGVHNLRDWTSDVHQSVDSTPCGGGPGMVMKPQVWGDALDDVIAGRVSAARSEELRSAVEHKLPGSGSSAGAVVTRGAAGLAATESDVAELDMSESASSAGGGAGTCDADAELAESTPNSPLIIVPTPAGVPLTQDMAQRWSAEEHIIFACGRYEGIDQRVIEDAARHGRVEEVSIGDYVLIGGEAAVLVMVEAIVRLIPGVLGNQSSHQEDSFQDGLLEGPCYTRPRVWRGLEVPEVLFSGNHAHIQRWRREESLRRTLERRPELLEQVELSAVDQAFLRSLHETESAEQA